MPDLLAELLAFPLGKTDDQVDSIRQALAYKRGYGWTTESLDGLARLHEALIFHLSNLKQTSVAIAMFIAGWCGAHMG